MARGRRHLRVHAFVRAALVWLGAGGALHALPVLPLAVIVAQPAQPQPPASKQVAIHILVIEADKKSGDWDKRLESLRESIPGYAGAKLLDELNTSAEEGSSVSLEIQGRSASPRLLKVSVRKVQPDVVKLRVAIEALKFSIDTNHPKGAPVVVGHPLSKEKSLFLVVTPKI